MGGGPRAETRYGTIEGIDLGGVQAFLGIRYAVSPEARELRRFGPPVAPPPWRGVRPADRVGPVAPQVSGGLGGYLPGERFAQDEECRTVNIWTPAADDGRRPVLVFLHGGAFLNGSGASALYAGDRLARGGAVVVTCNYRLGAFGFLAHPALAHPAVEGCANFGLADQLAALRFVREHAAAFGGDPERVTIFGESAGAMSVAALVGMQAARGLFQGAVIQSGMAFARPLVLAAAFAEELSVALGLGAVERDALVAVPTDELLAAQASLTARVDEGLGMPLGPAIDGGLLGAHPADLIANGAGSPGVPLLAGTNRDEFTLFSIASPLARDLDEARLRDLVQRYLDSAGLADPIAPVALLETYRTARAARQQATDPRALLNAFGTDWIFRVPLLRLLDAHGTFGASTYCYRFDWGSPLAAGALGACHGIELPFVFGSVEHELAAVFTGGGEKAEALSAAMRAAWIAFAGSGNPSCAQLPTWPTYEATARRTMVLGSDPHIEEAPGEPERRFFAEHLGAYGHEGPIAGARPRSLSFLAPLGEERGPGTDPHGERERTGSGT